MGTTWIHVGCSLDPAWTQRGKPRFNLDPAWIQLGFNWIQNVSILDLARAWAQLGSDLDPAWIWAGSSLDPIWIQLGSSWTHRVSSLDPTRIHVGPSLDPAWIQLGSRLDLALIQIGSSLGLQHVTLLCQRSPSGAQAHRIPICYCTNCMYSKYCILYIYCT